MAKHIEVAYLLPFAAGNFVYIAAADLLPEIASEERTRDKIETTAAFITGLVLLLAAVATVRTALSPTDGVVLRAPIDVP